MKTWFLSGSGAVLEGPDNRAAYRSHSIVRVLLLKWVLAVASLDANTLESAQMQGVPLTCRVRPLQHRAGHCCNVQVCSWARHYALRPIDSSSPDPNRQIRQVSERQLLIVCAVCQ